MLYIKDKSGSYHPAPKETILAQARRLSASQLRRGALITSPLAAREAVGLKLAGLDHELFACLFLDSRHHVLAWREMFRGTVNRTTVHPRELVREALDCNASAVILAHNHPSGCADPSREDVELTRTLADILKMIDVRVLDHLIVGEQVVSLVESGYSLA